MLLAQLRRPEPSLIEQFGGWPTILLMLWLGVALGLFLARMLAFRRERRPSSTMRAELGAHRFDPPGPLARRQRPAGLRHLRPGDRGPGRFRPALCRS